MTQLNQVKKDQSAIASLLEFIGPGFPVDVAFVHAAVNSPGVINTERTLSSAKIKDAQLFWHPKGSVIRVVTGKTHTFVPHAQFVNWIVKE